MKVAIHQPQYWPWPPYIHKVMSADVFVYLDTVQFSKNGFQNRNQVRSQKNASWLTIPVKHHFGQSILDTKIADPKVVGRHLKTLAGSYSNTPGYKKWKDEIQGLVDAQTDSLCDIAIASTEWILEKLSVKTRRLRASEIPNLEGANSALVAAICKHLDATSYLTGDGATAYLKRDDFSKVKCEVWVQQWHSFEYQQAHSETGFISDLSSLDLLLNCPDTAFELIQSAGDWQLMWDAE